MDMSFGNVMVSLSPALAFAAGAVAAFFCGVLGVILKRHARLTTSELFVPMLVVSFLIAVAAPRAALHLTSRIPFGTSLCILGPGRVISALVIVLPALIGIAALLFSKRQQPLGQRVSS